MSKTLSDIRTILKNKSQSPNISDTYLNDAINEAISVTRAKYKLPSAKRKATITIYPNVNIYPLPIQTGETTTDFDSICDLQEWWDGEMANTSNFRRTTQSILAQKPNTFTDLITEYSYNGNKMLLVNYTPPESAEITLNTFDSYDGDGTWTATGEAGSVATDIMTYVQGSGSVKFNVTAAGGLSAGIYNTGTSSTDLDDYEYTGRIFAYVYIPAGCASYITSIDLRWGSSDSAYWSNSVTTQHNGLAFTEGWNLVSVAWSSATETGTVDNTAINYLRVNFNYSASLTSTNGFRVDGMYFRLGQELSFEYNSSRWVRDSNGIWLDEFISSTDYFVGTNDELYLIVYSALSYIHRAVVIDDVKAQYWEQKFINHLNELRSLNPHDIKQKGQEYYNL